jgi:hypothetical protein
LTFGEYKAKKNGFFENQNNYLKQQSWLIGMMAAKAMNVSEKHPYPTISEFMNNEEPKQEETDEELFKLAQKKEIEIPEGVV